MIPKISETQYDAAFVNELGWCIECEGFTTENVPVDVTPCTHDRACIACNEPLYGVDTALLLEHFYVL